MISNLSSFLLDRKCDTILPKTTIEKPLIAPYNENRGEGNDKNQSTNNAKKRIKRGLPIFY